MNTTLTAHPAPTTTPTELPAHLLDGFRSRAGALDRANAYFHEDLAELRSIGYLAAPVPSRRRLPPDRSQAVRLQRPGLGWLGAHAIDAAAPGGPQIVHTFVERGSEGVTVVETWDTMGMRPTQSHDTVLDHVFVPDERIGRVTPASEGTTCSSWA